MKYSSTLLLPPALLATLMIGDALGHNQVVILGYPVSWDNASMEILTSEISFNTQSVRNAAEAARDAWNECPSSFEMDMEHHSWFTLPGDGASTMWFTSQSYQLSGALATTFLYAWGGQLSEADVLFDANETWYTGTSKESIRSYGGSAIGFRTVAVHELGHVLGLDHEDDTYNVMGDAERHLSTNGSKAHAYVGEDASRGAIAIYGEASGAKEDVGVVHWRRVGRAGGYSLHGRTAVFREDGSTSSFTDTASNPNGEPGWEVSRGEIVDVEFSFENNGPSSQRPQVDFVLSLNDTATNLDTVLHSQRITMNPNTVYTRLQSLRIPSSLQVGNVYYLGAVVDPDDRLDEYRESNNATYTAIKIVP